MADDYSAMLKFAGFRCRSSVSWVRGVHRCVTGDQGAEGLTVLTVAALGFPGVGRQGERTGRSQEPIVIWGHIIADVR